MVQHEVSNATNHVYLNGGPSHPGGEYKVWVSRVSTFDEDQSKTDNSYTPVETNWMHTTEDTMEITLNADDDVTVEFGNVCLGAGGGLTLGFWSNKKGQALFGGDDKALMSSLNLRNAAGAAFDPASYSAFRTWLLSATATNMAYMLSAQLAAMELNVYKGKVNCNALVYAPGTQGANSLGFITVNNLMSEANTELGVHGLVLSDSPFRAYQEALKNALDKANNNFTFVQPYPFSIIYACCFRRNTALP